MRPSRLLLFAGGLALFGFGGFGLARVLPLGATSPSEGARELPAAVREAPDRFTTERVLAVHTGLAAPDGAEILVNCSSCHATRTPRPERRSGAALEHYHQGLVTAHGELSCLSCHDPRDYRRFRLADGRSIPMSRVTELCAQCHGPQARDYREGSHGGVFGAWDASAGPRARRDCLHCHDAHAPAFPSFSPVFHPMTRRPAADPSRHEEPKHR